MVISSVTYLCKNENLEREFRTDIILFYALSLGIMLIGKRLRETTILLSSGSMIYI